MSLRRLKDSEPESAATESVVRDSTPDAALDAVAAILRVLRQTAARDSDAASRLEAWTRHILVLASPPGSEDAVCLRPRAHPVDEPVCLVMVDIDHFKQLNDVHGHTTGDSALEAIARALVRSFPRRSDVLTRFGGDEFAVILHDAAAADGGRLADRFLAAVRELEVPEARDTVKVTVSAGVAEALLGEPADSWVARADRALYEAKAEGRDCVAIAVGESVERSLTA